MSSANVSHVESYSPIFDAARDEMVVHIAHAHHSDPLVMSATKVEQQQFRERYGERVELAHFYETHPVNPSMAWENQVEEQISLPTRWVH